jgi:hypothetical protein
LPAFFLGAALPAGFFAAAFFGATFFTADAVLASGFFAAAVAPLADFPLDPGVAAERAADCLAAAFTTDFAGVFLAGVFFAGVFFTVPPIQPMGTGLSRCRGGAPETGSRRHEDTVE